MTIEIHSPNLQVSEETIQVIEEKILTLSHLGEKISRAEVYLTQDTALPEENKICKIRLTIYGDDLFVRKNASSFEVAATTALKVLKRNLKKKQEQHNTLPDDITSTVEIE